MPNPMLPTGPGMITHPQTPVLTGSGNFLSSWELPIQYGIRGPYVIPEGSHTRFKTLSFSLQPGSSNQVRQEPGLPPSPKAIEAGTREREAANAGRREMALGKQGGGGERQRSS